MSLQSEATLAELRRADPRHFHETRAYRDHMQALDIEEDEAAATVTRTAAPITAAVLTIIGAAVVGIGVWSWIGSG